MNISGNMTGSRRYIVSGNGKHTFMAKSHFESAKGELILYSDDGDGKVVFTSAEWLSCVIEITNKYRAVKPRGKKVDVESLTVTDLWG